MTTSKQFLDEKLKLIFTEKSIVLDIGGGLRVVKEKNNRYAPDREWLRPLIGKVDYKIMDPVPDYNPDILGDIHKIPLGDSSQDAVICLAVLEHVENPILAVEEMKRVLRPGGYCLIYVPFLYYYHAEKGYYKDYWRFTGDAMEMLSKGFSKMELTNMHGALETWVKLSPLARVRVVRFLAEFIDRVSGKTKSLQTSGYAMFLTK